MKRILLAGYFGMDNLGDEAILEGEFRYFREKLPLVEIAVLSGNPRKTSEIFHCPSYHRTSPKELIPAISSCDLLILGGGGLLQDVTSFRSILYYLFLLEFARNKGKRTAVFSVGIGPLRRKISQKLVAWVLKRVDDVSLRDESSLDWAKNRGVRKAYLSADASFLLQTPYKEEGKKAMGVVLRFWKGINYEGIKEFLLKIKEKGLSLTYLVFNPADYALSLSLVKETGGELLKPTSPKEAIDILSRLEGTIAMRLHGGILSAIAGAPFLAISYDPKVEAISKELGQPFLPLNASNIMMVDAFEVWLSTKENLKLVLKERCSLMRERLEKSFERIKGLLYLMH